MQRILMPVLGLLGFILLCLICVLYHAPRIEAELRDQGRERLTAAGFDSATLEVEGRDATLTGWAANGDDRAVVERLVAGVPGMRAVDNRLELPGAVRFVLDRSGDDVVLKGLLPSAAHRDAIVSQARDLWGAEVATGELLVDPEAEAPDWLAGLPGALAAFSRRTQGGSLAIDGGELTISGRVFAESARDALHERLGQVLPGLSIANLSEVRPPADAAELQATLDAAVLSRTVEFASGSAELTDLGRSVLDEIFELLSSQEGVRIAVSGHTDDQGDAAYNLELSRRRAEAARDYLVGRGLAADRFETAGFGESRPIADNATPEGRLRNRRLEFVVLRESSLEETP